MDTEPTLESLSFKDQQLSKYLQYAAAGLLEKKEVLGLQFVLRSVSVQQIFTNNHLAHIEEIIGLLDTICKAYTKVRVEIWTLLCPSFQETIKRHSSGENFIVNCMSNEISFLFGQKTAEGIHKFILKYIFPRSCCRAV